MKGQIRFESDLNPSSEDNITASSKLKALQTNYNYVS